jgi:hypothetical protein
MLAVDPMYKMDDNSIPDWLRPEGLQQILQSFDGKTTADQYTIVVFCGFAQAESFRQVLINFCRYMRAFDIVAHDCVLSFGYIS